MTDVVGVLVFVSSPGQVTLGREQADEMIFLTAVADRSISLGPSDCEAEYVGHPGDCLQGSAHLVTVVVSKCHVPGTDCFVDGGECLGDVEVVVESLREPSGPVGARGRSWIPIRRWRL